MSKYRNLSENKDKMFKISLHFMLFFTYFVFKLLCSNNGELWLRQFLSSVKIWLEEHPKYMSFNFFLGVFVK